MRVETPFPVMGKHIGKEKRIHICQSIQGPCWRSSRFEEWPKANIPCYIFQEVNLTRTFIFHDVVFCLLILVKSYEVFAFRHCHPSLFQFIKILHNFLARSFIGETFIFYNFGKLGFQLLRHMFKVYSGSKFCSQLEFYVPLYRFKGSSGFSIGQDCGPTVKGFFLPLYVRRR